jgi:DNA-binding NarL/FixJ family response regulator
MEKKIRVMIADDHAVVRAGAASILSTDPDIEVIGEARDGLEAVEKALVLKPDVILMDFYMPRATGLEALQAIHAKMPDPPRILFLTVSDQEKDLFTALRQGAQGYILKSASMEEVLKAVKLTASGQSILSPDLATRLVDEFKKGSSVENTLTSREREVLKLIGEGLTNAEIAQRLIIGETTVRTHFQRLLYKLQLKNRAEAIAYAQRHNLSTI